MRSQPGCSHSIEQLHTASGRALFKCYSSEGNGNLVVRSQDILQSHIVQQTSRKRFFGKDTGEKQQGTEQEACLSRVPWRTFPEWGIVGFQAKPRSRL